MQTVLSMKKLSCFVRHLLHGFRANVCLLLGAPSNPKQGLGTINSGRPRRWSSQQSSAECVWDPLSTNRSLCYNWRYYQAWGKSSEGETRETFWWVRVCDCWSPICTSRNSDHAAALDPEGSLIDFL